MDTIKLLFDPSKDIYRTIEKVITYNVAQDIRLKTEVSEYVVTESIENQFEKLLTKMQNAMDFSGENEIGVWVSGFYGSGKSSFTKYLGLAFDDQIQIDGAPFLNHLQNRLRKPQTKALIGAITKRFPAAVIMLDLASEMLAGATGKEVSTVLFYKVLQWAGYSQNLKVFRFERKLEEDNRYEEFRKKVKENADLEWPKIQNDPLVIDSIIPEIAHQIYPDLFKTPTSFSTETSEYIQFENERVEEMIDIVRSRGKDYIIFIVDEVGQYVGSSPKLILNLDGLAKNLKNIGAGKVWFIGTAQQTLTEDDPKAALNSPELYKLKDRFPIQIDLESRDIKEICYRRLLGKSSDGEKQLGDLFDTHGQELRFNTKLKDAKYYDSEFNKETFVNLYPFLPSHFDILLHLLGALAKSTGGIGLRSAIKVVQDILIEEIDHQKPLAESTIGCLATTVTIYDSLEKDIRKGFASLHQAVGKVLIRFPDSEIHQDVAKTVAILQILSNMPVSSHNVSSLMHPSVMAAFRREEIEKIINDLINDSHIPFGEKDGNLGFYSEKLHDIEQERAQIPLRSSESRRLFNELLKESFTPLPSTRLDGTLAVTTGLKSRSGSFDASLAGDREAIQTVIELVDPGDYETGKLRLIEDSRQSTFKNVIFLLGRRIPEIEERISEIYRCREICQRYRNQPDQEVKDYCSGQSDRANKLSLEIQRHFKSCLSKGSFIFRGQTTAVESLDVDVIEATKKYLGQVVGQVFDRYSEAPIRVETSIAEKFLKFENLAAMTSKEDPLGLVKIVGGRPTIHTDYKALQSIRDYIDRNGNIEGRKLIDHFTRDPFGWSQDTLRYLVASLLVGGELKLKVSGHEVTVKGQQAIDALKTNNTFKPVGVALRQERPSNEVLARAAERLTDLVGDTVFPLEDDISKASVKNFPQLQSRFAPLGEKLTSLGLPGGDRIQSIIQNIADLLSTDASDAPLRLGGEQSTLYDDLKWAKEIDLAFKKDVGVTIGDLQDHRREILDLPRTGLTGELKDELNETLVQLSGLLAKEDYYDHIPDLNTMLTNIKSVARKAVSKMAEEQINVIKESQADLSQSPEWGELTQEEQLNMLSQLESLEITVTEDLKGLKQLVNQEFVIYSELGEIKNNIEEQGRKRRLARIEEEREKAKKSGESLTRTLKFPKSVTEVHQLEELITQLQEIKNDLELFKDIKINIEFDE